MSIILPESRSEKEWEFVLTFLKSYFVVSVVLCAAVILIGFALIIIGISASASEVSFFDVKAFTSNASLLVILLGAVMFVIFGAAALG